MRTTIRHGGTLETATPAEVETIVSRYAPSSGGQQFHREKGAINLDAGGAGSAALDVSPQFDWILERLTATAAANGLVQLFENNNSPADLLEVAQLSAAGLYSDAFAGRLFVPAGSRLIIVVSSGGANGQATFNLQIRLQPIRGASG